MINNIERIESLIKQIPDFIKKKFNNEDNTLRLYDLLNYVNSLKDRDINFTLYGKIRKV